MQEDAASAPVTRNYLWCARRAAGDPSVEADIMRRYGMFRWGACVTLVGLIGCVPPSGGGGTGDGTGENGGTGGVTAGGFEDAGLAAPAELPVDVENLPPTGEVVFPPPDTTVPAGEVVFVWEATDGNGSNVDSTVYVSDQPDVFENPLVTPGLRTPPEETQHRLTVQFADPGSFYWGVEITDGVNTLRRPVDEVGVPFEVSASAFSRIGLEDAILLCPRASLPARGVTTFVWSLGATEPVRTEVFVSRAGVENPFESPMRILLVEPATATSWPITEEEVLPLNEELRWGLRIETADEVLFTFAGQLGVSFVAQENVPPSGQLLAPEIDTVFPDDSVLELVWEDDAGNCEDVLTLTLGLEFLGAGTEPMDLFGSDFQLTAQGDSAEADLAPQLADLDLAGGRWAWGVLADDGTDQTELSDADHPDRNFRTFIRDTSPEFVQAPAIVSATCGADTTTHDALTFSYSDDNGTETVNVTVSFAASEANVFGDAAPKLELTAADAGASPAARTVFVTALDGGTCTVFAEGPGFYGVQLDDGVNEPVRAVAEFSGPPTGPPTGACCAPNGACAQVAQDECTNGVYQGDGTNCSAVDCVVEAVGACCLVSGACVEGLQDACTNGQYQGDGTTCDAVQCFVPVSVGACCLPDGSCTDGTSSACTGGVYQGDGTSCLLTTCPPPPDCNSNGVPDSQDIALGTSNDCDTNGVPDECEDVGAIVDAGTLAAGTINAQLFYDSTANNNDLSGRLCPLTGTPQVRWSLDSIPLGADVIFGNVSAVTSSYTIRSAVAGDYVFRLTWVDQNIWDTVTLTLTGP